MKLTDIHKQKLWSDFLMWSGGKSFYEVPMEPGMDGFINDHLHISGWLNTLPESWHKPLIEWVKCLKECHDKRDKLIFDSYSKDIMYQKEWKDGYPVSFEQRNGQPSMLDFSKDPTIVILQNFLHEQFVGSKKLPLQIMCSNKSRIFTTSGFELVNRPGHRLLNVTFKEELELPLLITQNKWINVSKFKMSANIITATSPEFYYIVDHDERGKFRARVVDVNDKEVLQYGTDEDGKIDLVEDGFLKYAKDIKGIEKYLIQNGQIPKNSVVLKK